LIYHVELKQIIAYLDTISATTIQGTEDTICLEKTTERLGGDIMLLSTLDKNHLSNLANLHHTTSELLIGGGGRGWG
jgi:hypothetical protein